MLSTVPPHPLLFVPVVPFSFIKNVRFIAIDIDAAEELNGHIQQFHFGISILDTQDLLDLLGLHSSSGAPKTITQAIRSHHFVIGSTDFGRKQQRKFLFGRPQVISYTDLRTRLSSWVTNQNIILAFHGGARELSFLRRLDLQFRPLCIIDTAITAQYPLQLPNPCSLRALLMEFGVTFRGLHSSGNDAHFVIRALLMLVVRDAETQSSKYPLPSWLSALKATAGTPLPQKANRSQN